MVRAFHPLLRQAQITLSPITQTPKLQQSYPHLQYTDTPLNTCVHLNSYPCVNTQI